jgi:hypothetical protein
MGFKILNIVTQIYNRKPKIGSMLTFGFFAKLIIFRNKKVASAHITIIIIYVFKKEFKTITKIWTYDYFRSKKIVKIVQLCYKKG